MLTVQKGLKYMRVSSTDEPRKEIRKSILVMPSAAALPPFIVYAVYIHIV